MVVGHYGCGHESSHKGSAIVAKKHRQSAGSGSSGFHAWEQCREADQDVALGLIEGLTRSPGRYSTKQKCRDLTLLRSPLPSSMSSVPPLSADDLSVFFGAEVTPSRRGGDSDNESVR